MQRMRASRPKVRGRRTATVPEGDAQRIGSATSQSVQRLVDDLAALLAEVDRVLADSELADMRKEV